MAMPQVAGPVIDLERAWVDDEDDARWQSATCVTGAASGSSMLEVPAGCRLPRHTDSAEETIVVVAGRAEVEVDGEVASVPEGAVAVVPKDAPHSVRNAGNAPLRFVAVYAANDVVTRYEAEVQPDGGSERQTIG